MVVRLSAQILPLQRIAASLYRVVNQYIAFYMIKHDLLDRIRLARIICDPVDPVCVIWYPTIFHPFFIAVFAVYGFVSAVWDIRRYQICRSCDSLPSKEKKPVIQRLQSCRLFFLFILAARLLSQRSPSATSSAFKYADDTGFQINLKGAPPRHIVFVRSRLCYIQKSF